MFDGKAFGAEIVTAVKGHMADMLAPLTKRLDEMQKQIEAMRDMVGDDEVAKTLAFFGELKSDVETRLDGFENAIKAIEPAPSLPDIPAMIEECVKKHVDAIPVIDVPAVVIDDFRPLIADELQKRISELPCPKDGKDGLDIKDLFANRDGHLIAVMTNGETKDLGQFIGKDGEDGEKGKDGTDGVGFDDLDLVVADDGVAIVFTRGDEKKAFPLPVPIDRGVYKEGSAYRKGNAVTWGGQLWIAQKNNPEGKPGDGDAWRLSVKKGRDAKPSQAKI